MIDIEPAKAETENEAVAFTETENNPTEMVGDEDIDNFKDTDPKEEVKILPCESCLKFYNYQRDLADSMCDECKVIIADKEDLYLPNIFQCDICLKTFKTKTQFMKHKQCEASSFTYTCEVCSLLWKDQEVFENHMKQKHTKHTCIRCNMKVEDKENLDAHFRTRHRAF